MQQVNKTFRQFQVAENRTTKKYGDLFVTEEVTRNILKSRMYNYFSAFKSNIKYTRHRISVFTVIFTVGRSQITREKSTLNSKSRSVFTGHVSEAGECKGLRYFNKFCMIQHFECSYESKNIEHNHYDRSRQQHFNTFSVTIRQRSQISFSLR